MNATNTKTIQKLGACMSKACIETERMVCDNEDASIVLLRALQRDPTSTADELEVQWMSELDIPPDREMVELFLELHHLFGEDWHIVCAHYRMREENADCRGDETQEECPFYGDDIEDVRGMWADRFSAFDRKRSGEEAAAKAWLARQWKKVA